MIEVWPVDEDHVLVRVVDLPEANGPGSFVIPHGPRWRSRLAAVEKFHLSGSRLINTNFVKKTMLEYSAEFSEPVYCVVHRADLRDELTVEYDQSALDCEKPGTPKNIDPTAFEDCALASFARQQREEPERLSPLDMRLASNQWSSAVCRRLAERETARGHEARRAEAERFPCQGTLPEDLEP